MTFFLLFGDICVYETYQALSQQLAYCGNFVGVHYDIDEISWTVGIHQDETSDLWFMLV